MLRKLPEKISSQATLQEGLILFSQWRYRESLAPLRCYIEKCEAGSDSQIVGATNLCAALIALGEFSEAKDFLRRYIPMIQQKKYTLMDVVTATLKAQIHLSEKSYAEARRCLNEAERKLDDNSSLYHLLICKWRSLVTLFENPGLKELEPLKKLRAEAGRLKNWETVRDCDFYLGFFGGEKKILYQVFYGTPYPLYVSQKLHLVGWSYEDLPSEIYWIPGKGVSKSLPKRFLDLSQAKDAFGAQLKMGKLLHRLLTALTQDFYRPMRTGTLFTSLYPNEEISSESSILRVENAIYRLRSWFKVHKIPLQILYSKDGCQLISTRAYAVKINRPHDTVIDLDSRIQKLQLKFGEEDFKLEEAMKVLSMSKPSASRLLRQARETGALSKISVGRQKIYRFTHSNLRSSR